MPLTALVALATAVVVTGIAVEGGKLAELVPQLPVFGPRWSGAAPLAVGAVAALVVLLFAGAQAAASARHRARRRALESAHAGEVNCGIRHRQLRDATDELTGRTANLPRRYTISADDEGVTFWRGGRRPRREVSFAWREVRGIRSDRLVIGETAVPIAVLRVRRNGVSVELPILIADERRGRFALVDAAFYATVRGWKAQHRRALERDGLELPTPTEPITVAAGR